MMEKRQFTEEAQRNGQQKKFSVIGVIAQIQTLSKVIPIYCVQASLSPKFAHLHQQEAEMFMLFNSLMFTTIK